MFLENTLPINTPCGSIEVITGSMFSGKTEELIRRLKRVKIAHLNVMTFKPTIDVRYSDFDVVSHNQNSVEAIPVQAARVINNMVGDDVQVVAIDEAQFFDEYLPAVVVELARRGKRVIVAGLDTDYLGQPFGPMPEVMAVADDITKLRAICSRCGRLATFSYRIGESTDQVLLGEGDEYTPLCRNCYEELMHEKDHFCLKP